MSILPSDENKSLRKSVYKITEILGANSQTGELYTSRITIITIFQAFAAPMVAFGLYDSWPDTVKMCILILASTVGVKSLIKGLSRVIKNDEKMFTKLDKIIDKFYLENEKFEDFRKILSKHVNNFKFWVRMLILLMFVLFNGPIMTSWYQTFTTGKYVLYAPVHIPFTDPETITGFLINQIYLTLLPVSFFLTVTFGEFYNFYLTLQLIPMVEIFNIKLKKFSDKIEKLKKIENKLGNKIENIIHSSVPTRRKSILNQNHHFRSTITKPHKRIFKIVPNPKRNLRKTHEKISKKVNEQFMNIIKDYNSYNNFISIVLTFMEWATFFTFSIDSFSIGLSIVVLRFYSTFLGIALAIMLTLFVFMQCIEGAIVVHQNEKLLKEVCGLPWYNLSKNQQKIFLQFIHACQNTSIFTVPIIGDLNMELFSNVVNGAYSFLMYIIQFVKIAK